MKIGTIIDETAQTVAAIPYLAGRPVMTDEQRYSSSELENRIAQENFSVIVGCNGLSDVVTEENDGVYGKLSVVVTISENPAENRRDLGAPTLLLAAQEIAMAINGCGTDEMDDTMHLNGISPVRKSDNGVIECDVEFSTKVNL